jgi:uncharacterized protein (UPF0332 family)
MSTEGEVAALVQKVQKFIASAGLLRQYGDPASAASRLYHPMFYCAEALMLTKGLSYSKHGTVISAFGQHFAKTGELPPETHQWLRSAFDKRQVADCEAQPVLTDADVRVAEKTSPAVSDE